MAAVDTPSLFLEFFGEQYAVTAPAAQLADLRFFFGPHAVARTTAPNRLRVEFPGPGEYIVRRDNSAPLLRRTFRDWGNLPPPVPPFAVMRDRYLLLPAVVLAKGGTAAALVGGPGGARTGTAVALARLGWRFVSGQLLVVDRTTGHTLPYLAPLELRGATRASVDLPELPQGVTRARRSPVSGEVLLIRPEGVGGAVPIGSTLAPPRLVRLCRGTGEAVRFTRWDLPALTWPPDGAEGAGPGEPWETYRLEIGAAGGMEEAACLIDQEYGTTEPGDSPEPGTDDSPPLQKLQKEDTHAPPIRVRARHALLD
jgi:hypothetical protein